MPRKSSDIIVGLDIGTTKIAAVVGEIGPEGLDIIGVGTHPSRGLKKGVIVNIDSTVASIKQAILEAESMSGCEISQVYVGIAGGHIKGVNSTGTVAIKDKEVRPPDVVKVLELARAIALPVDRHIIHVLPQEYKIDGQDGVREPLGMCGVRPSISFASLPTASICALVVLNATIDGSLSTMPRPRANTHVLAVPRSIARSFEKNANAPSSTGPPLWALTSGGKSGWRGPTTLHLSASSRGTARLR